MTIKTTSEAKRAIWKGKKTEQELVKLLREKGWRAVRGATVAQGIDAIATRRNELAIFEVKHAKEDSLSVNIETLIKFCELFDGWDAGTAVGVVAVKFPYRGWRLKVVWNNTVGRLISSNSLTVKEEVLSDFQI